MQRRLHYGALQKHEAAIQRMMQRQQEETAKRYQQEMTDLLTKVFGGIFDKAIAYTNIVIFGGYAGFFAIWAYHRDDIPTEASLLAVLLVSFSLIVFCFWEVARMMINGFELKRWAALLNRTYSPDAFIKAIEEAQVRSNRATIRFYQAWYLILILTIFPAFGGGLLLFYNFLARLIGWSMWPDGGS